VGLVFACALGAGLVLLLSGGPRTVAARPLATAPAPGSTNALPVSARGPIAAALGRLEPAYRIVDLRARNAAQGLRASFSPRGASVSTGSGRLGLELSAYGSGTALRTLGPAAPHVDMNRVSYVHGPVTEWWANGPLGLEQGFDVGSRAIDGAGPLVLSLDLSGNLRARLDGGGVLLRGAGAALRYDGLVASDATGRRLGARLMLRGAHLRIEVDTRGARFPVRIDPFVQQAELTYSGGAVDSTFGRVAVGGNTIAVGAPGPASAPGAVYVFVKPSGGWSTTASPSATLTESSMQGLGESVAIDAAGDTIVAGAVPQGQILCINCEPEGAVYVYTRPLSGIWQSSSTPAELSPNDLTAGYQVGESVAIDAGGDTIVAGAPSKEIESNKAQGAAYVFARPTTGGWQTTTNQTAELSAAASGAGEGEASEELGATVAISSDGATVAAGAVDYEVGTNTGQGGVYVFEQPGTSWNHGASDIDPSSFLTASDGAEDDLLGEAVTISQSGSMIVAGAPDHGSGKQGAAYVFVEPGIGWLKSATQNAELTAQLGYDNDLLGSSLAITSGGTVLAGARGGSTAASPPASVYAFDEPAAGWPSAASNLVMHESYSLSAAGGALGDGFGSSISVSDGTLVVGAPAQAVGANRGQGAAYVFGFPSPAVTIKTPVNGGSYAQGAKIDSSYACAVTGSTISSCVGPVASGGRIDTASTGTHSFAVTATTIDGEQVTKSVTYTVLAPPVLSRVSESQKRWHKNTKFSFTVNEQVTVALVFGYAASGRRQHKKCVAETAGNRRDPKCTRTAGTLSVSVGAGKHKITFTGRVGHKKLAPGSYRVTITATNAARGKSRSKSLSFTLTR
jgi:trimeric autotransporter adhesin